MEKEAEGRAFLLEASLDLRKRKRLFFDIWNCHIDIEHDITYKILVWK